jgi:hypothetical protein
MHPAVAPAKGLTKQPHLYRTAPQDASFSLWAGRQSGDSRRRNVAACRLPPRSGDALPEIAHASMHRGIATPPNDHAAARTSRRWCRGLFRTRSYPQILLKTLKKLLDGQPLPIEVFRIATDQVRKVTIEPKLLGKR